MSINRQHRRQLQRQGREAAGDGGTDAPDGELTDTAISDAALTAAALSDTNGGGGSGGGVVTGGGGDREDDDDNGGGGAPSALRSRNGRGSATAVAPVNRRVAPRQFLHEVNVELRKVAWPTRAETINYSTVVFVTLAILMALIFALDLVFTHLASFLFSS